MNPTFHNYLANYFILLLSQKRVGATTVASTMILARAAGIPVFVTGGIGGVHRGAEQCKPAIQC